MAIAEKDYPKIASSNDGMTFVSKAEDCSTCTHQFTYDEEVENINSGVLVSCKHPEAGKKSWKKLTMADCRKAKKYRKITQAKVRK